MGSSRFLTYLLTSFLFSTFLEAALSMAATTVAASQAPGAPHYLDFAGLLAVGP
jgi:hypothetical protein